ncbi:unnamed protein product [Coregonus sp. 'balchen']|nr:unnamed protein product [Coregonus sp. 'balchen']
MNASLSKGSLLDGVFQEGFNEQQLSAYVLWVNSQLKKRPGQKPITDLRVDLQDGVVLSHLVEIVAGEVLEGVYEAPRDREESRENVERVLSFITSRRIRMPHTSARGVGYEVCNVPPGLGYDVGWQVSPDKHRGGNEQHPPHNQPQDRTPG